MYRILTALVVTALLIVAVAASADVTITTPQEGAVVGPSTPIYGQCSERAFVVIISDVLAPNGTKIGSVPGIRHWTNDDNSISVRIATPRVVFGEKGEPVSYVIHVRAYSTPDRAQAGDAPDVGEATITVKSE